MAEGGWVQAEGGWFFTVRGWLIIVSGKSSSNRFSVNRFERRINPRLSEGFPLRFYSDLYRQNCNLPRRESNPPIEENLPTGKGGLATFGGTVTPAYARAYLLGRIF